MLRVNYGFTSKRRFGESMQIHEVNYENIRVVENAKRADGTPCEHVARRIICFKVGKAKFTTDDAEVNHEAGVFKKIVRERLIDLL